MRSEQQGQRPAYLGVDLSDRYGKTPRPVWVCGLIIEDGRASAQFWPWLWPAPGEPLDVAPLLPELQAARVVLIAGPQGLAGGSPPMGGGHGTGETRLAGGSVEWPRRRPAGQLGVGSNRGARESGADGGWGGVRARGQGSRGKPGAQ